jgi:hypothetical protein
MEAIRQFIKVNGRNINITLPDDFNADEVEVIILPSSAQYNTIPEWQIQQVRERGEAYQKNPSSAEDFDKAMKDIEDKL